ncbi:DUF4932 domain-containing protein [Thermococcus barophilus]|uniref:Uncharacterized protein n=1 Tax=Thermococcus barophilus TaxID=55802 RepID=A0A0S1XA34_THEBA|nr:DUF4932 domain-containing protein [Thermococcus barophilus]ALM74650.1 conserved exported hypothetical protein; putative S-layer protein [Thermococcus barophilus]
MRKLLIFLIFVILTSPVYSYQYQTDKVYVEINPNEELLSIVYYLAFGADEFVIPHHDYIQDVEAYFASYKNHTAVQILRQYFSDAETIPQRDYKLFVLDAYILQFSNPPEMKRIYAGWQDSDLDKIIDALRTFAQDTNFMEFFKAHERYYKRDLEVYASAIQLLPPDEFMKHYMNLTNVMFEFHLPYLLCIHGHSFYAKDNGTEIYGSGGMPPLVRRAPPRTLWSLERAKDTIFGLPLNAVYVNNRKFDELWILDFIYHELGHDITSEKLDEYYSSEVEPLRYLEDTIEEDMPYLGAYDIHFWFDTMMIYESFADAWAYFALSHIDKDYAEWNLQMQKAWGEFWQDYMITLYQKYTALSIKENRSFSEYIPLILRELVEKIPPENTKEIYENNVPVTPLRALDDTVREGEVVIVYGTQNPDKKGSEYDRETAEIVKSYLETFYSQWHEYIKIEVKADVNMTNEDLRKDLILIGGPVSNKVVQQFEGYFPLRFVYKNGAWILEKNPEFGSVRTFLITPDNIKEIPFMELSYSSPQTSLLLAIRNPLKKDNYIIWIAGADRYSTRRYRNPTYYLVSYEIYDGEKIEDGFYVQPLLSS